MPNPRIRGKISHQEWPNIAARFQNGETLAGIARSYRCTAPAVRYILRRISLRTDNREIAGDKLDRLVALARSVENGRRSAGVQGSESRFHIAEARDSSLPPGPARDIWSRIGAEVTTFLAAMDSLSSDDSNYNYEALLAATDRLLRATARTRVELERILDNREAEAAARRVPGARTG